VRGPHQLLGALVERVERLLKFGGALALLGASQLALPESADLLLPIVLVILGFVLLTRQRA